MKDPAQNIYKPLAKLVSLIAAYIILLWFLFTISDVLLLLLFAVVIAIVINAPVTRLQNKGISRFWSCVIVFSIIIIVVGLLGWLIVPKIRAQIILLITNLPGYVDTLSNNLKQWFGDYPGIAEALKKQEGRLSPMLPSFPDALIKVGNYSLSLIGYLLVFIVFISMVIYMVTKPGPLIETYLSFFPLSQRDKAANALSKTSIMLSGWMKANLIGGAIEAVAVTAFLSFMKVPGAFVWGALAFLAMLVPKIGFYIMVIPPILVALTISPMTAVWVTAFFLLLDEILGDFVMPKIRSNTMKIHPVSSLFLLLIMGSAYGFKGVLIATPLAAIIKAYYEEFYLSRIRKDDKMQQRISQVINQKNGDAVN